MKTAFFDTKPYDRDFFSQVNDEIEIEFFETRLTAKTASLAKGADAVCSFVNDQIDAGCLTVLNQLSIKHIALRCAGYNHVDLKKAQELGISVTRVPAYSPHAVAEHTIALLLTLNRNIHRAHQRVREHNFSLNGLVGFDLHQKTVGILGAGKIGKITAELFKAFGCNVFVFDAEPDKTWCANHKITAAPLSEILERSDIISLHLPLNDGTAHLLDEAAFQKMKAGAYLVNTGRGKLIDTKAMLRALKSRKLSGVALDVYEEEEGVFFEDKSNEIIEDEHLSRLLTFPNVLMTSHQAFLTKEALSEIARSTCDSLVSIANDETPEADTQLV